MRISVATLLIALAGERSGSAAVVTPVAAERAAAVSEYAIKAVFLYNLVKYTDWPPESPLSLPGKPIVIAVIGEDPFGTVLDEALRDRTVRGRTFEVIRSNDLKNLRNVHLAFIAASEAYRAGEVVQVMTSRGALSVADKPEIAAAGPVVTFLIAQGKLRFDINRDRAKRCGIEFSSQLLKLARKIVEAGD